MTARYHLFILKPNTPGSADMVFIDLGYFDKGVEAVDYINEAIQLYLDGKKTDVVDGTRYALIRKEVGHNVVDERAYLVDVAIAELESQSEKKYDPSYYVGKL